MKISVIMATYNGARYLREQLESLSSQTLLPHELIVGDDGSTDNTVPLLKQFGKSAPFPTNIYPNPTRLGYVRNFLQQLSHATGELIAFCDQDDVWEIRKLATVAAYFTDPRVMLVIHSGCPVDENLNILPGKFPIIKKATRIPQESSTDKTLKSFPLGFSLVFRQAVAEEVSRRLQEYPEHDQFWFGHEMPVVWMARALGDTIVIPDPLVLYRRHQHNVTSGDGIRTPPTNAGLQNGAAQYRDFGAHAQARSTMLRRMSEGFSQSAANSSLERMAAVSERLSAAMQHRAMLYEIPRSVQRVKVMASMVVGGVYRARPRGGLGVKSFLKDVRSLLPG